MVTDEEEWSDRPLPPDPLKEPPHGATRRSTLERRRRRRFHVSLSGRSIRGAHARIAVHSAVSSSRVLRGRRSRSADAPDAPLRLPTATATAAPAPSRGTRFSGGWIGRSRGEGCRPRVAATNDDRCVEGAARYPSPRWTVAAEPIGRAASSLPHPSRAGEPPIVAGPAARRTLFRYVSNFHSLQAGSP